MSAKVQEKVKSAIENMTGLMVLDVNIKIAGSAWKKSKDCDCGKRQDSGKPGAPALLANLFYLDCVVIAVGMDVKYMYPGIRGDQAAFFSFRRERTSPV